MSLSAPSRPSSIKSPILECSGLPDLCAHKRLGNDESEIKFFSGDVDDWEFVVLVREQGASFRSEELRNNIQYEWCWIDEFVQVKLKQNEQKLKDFGEAFQPRSADFISTLYRRFLVKWPDLGLAEGHSLEVCFPRWIDVIVHDDLARLLDRGDNHVGWIW